jgi:hypothetical protein
MRRLLDRDQERRGRLPDAGPSPARYLAVLAGVTFTVLAVGTFMPAVGHSVRAGLCSRGDTGCQVTPGTVDDLGSCQVLSHADTVSDDAVVFTDDLGRSGRLTLSRTVDKNAVVHWFVRQAGVSESDPKRSELVAAASGQLTEFASEAAAREYIVAARHRPVRNRLIDADPTGLVSLLATRIDGHTIDNRAPQSYFVDGGGALDLGNEARSGVNGDFIAGGQTGIAEVKSTNVSRPVTTLYAQLSSAAVTALGLRTEQAIGLLPSPGVGAGIGVASVSFDWTGRATALGFEVAGELPVRLGPPFGSAGPNVMAGLVDPGPAVSGTTFTGRVSMNIDLTDGSTSAAAVEALHALGVPLLLDQQIQLSAQTRRPVDPEAGAEWVRDRVRALYQELDRGAEGTSVTVNTYRRLPATTAARQVALGLQGGLTITGSLPDNDYYYAPAQGFVLWQTCH